MLLTPIHECPQCGSALPREDCPVVKVPGRETHYFNCEFCGFGIELDLYPDGEIFYLDFYERTEPKNYGKFLQRLKDARAA